MSRRYEQGVRDERDVRRDLAENGYWVVRSAGSKTPVDLIAWKSGELIFAQAKRDGRMSPAEREALLDLANLVAAVPLLAAKTGPRGARLEYFRLTGPGPGDRERWTPDHALEAFADLDDREPERR